MTELKSIKDFKNLVEINNDSVNFFKILNQNLKTGRELTDILSKTLDSFKFSPLGEIFIELPQNIKNKEELKKYFNVVGNKIGSRGIGYYGLFGTAYLKNNRKTYFKEIKEKRIWESFWTEYDEYIKLMEKIKNNEKLVLIYLDNYRNFVLLWSYILTIIKKSNKKKYKVHPITGMVFQNIKTEEINDILENLINTYEIILKNTLSIVLENNKSNLFMIPSIESLYNNIKNLFNQKILLTKKNGKTSLIEYFKKSPFNTQIWFEKLFRNAREEDNLGVIFSFLLQKDINLHTLKDKNEIKKLIENYKNKKKNEFVISALYGGIEIALVAKYLGYKSGWVNYSVYHLNNQDTYINISDIFQPLGNQKDLKGEKVLLFDDNIGSGNTLKKLINILLNNHICIKYAAVPRIYLNKKERKLLKEYTKIYLTKLNNSYKIEEIRKHTALNVLYLLPRIKEKFRNINILSAKKVISFRKKFNKEFRSL